MGTGLESSATFRLFCFPYAGGGASIFRAWRAAFPSQIEVHPVQLPGRENRLGERPFSRIGPLIAVLAREIYPYLDRPFAFFGHSMGALIGFELSHFLHSHYGLAPVHLFVAAHDAPQVERITPPIGQLSDALFLEEIRCLNGTPEEVLQTPELLSLLLPLLRADIALCETYTYEQGSPLPVSLSAFGGLDDHSVSRAHLDAWCSQTTENFSLHMFSGGHFFLHSMRQELCHIIGQDLLSHANFMKRRGYFLK